MGSNIPSRFGIAMDVMTGGGADIKGSGEYVLLECGGPIYMYLAFRDTTRSTWTLNAMMNDEHGHAILLPIGQFDFLWEVKDAAWEDSGERENQRRLREHEEALDAKEQEARDQYRAMEIQAGDDYR